MIKFESLKMEQRQQLLPYLQEGCHRGCEYSFVNLYLWGRQKAAVVEDQLVVFSQFNRRSLYLYPAGTGDRKAALETIIRDAQLRGIPCRLTGMSQEDCQELEQLYPGKFQFHTDRDSYDYIYAAEDLALLKGRRFQRKRNHVNRFYQTHTQWECLPITPETADRVTAMVKLWYDLRQQEDPLMDYTMERAAIFKALDNLEALGLEGLMLLDEGQVVAMTLGSRLCQNTFDIHFEKALSREDSAYAVINQRFAQYLIEKYPEVRWLNREDDMGIPGLRKAKESYCPDHMIEKYWAHLQEDGYDY